jgi:hypothetical protein
MVQPMTLRPMLALLCCSLFVAACTADTTIDSSSTAETEAPNASSAEVATEVPTVAPEPTPEPTSEPTLAPTPVSIEAPDEPDTESDLDSSAAASRLAAEVAGSDFGLDTTEEACLGERLDDRFDDAQLEVLIDSSGNLEPDDPRLDDVIGVYEEIAGCMGAARVTDVLLEPDFNPEGYACFNEVYATEQERIDGSVALMIVELGDLETAPGRYEAILDQLLVGCADVG